MLLHYNLFIKPWNISPFTPNGLQHPNWSHITPVLIISMGLYYLLFAAPHTHQTLPALGLCSSFLLSLPGPLPRLYLAISFTFFKSLLKLYPNMRLTVSTSLTPNQFSCLIFFFQSTNILIMYYIIYYIYYQVSHSPLIMSAH